MRTSTPSFNNFIKNPLATVTILLSVSLVFLFLPPKVSNRIKVTCATPLRPMQWAVCLCSSSANNFFNKIITAWKDAQVRKQLEEQISSYKNTIIEQQDTIYKLQNKLQILSKFQAEDKNSKVNKVPADIIGYDTSSFRKSVVINVGSKQGVKPDDIVVSNNALVGKVSTVSGGTSVVLLITDPSSRVPGRVLQTREQVIVEGNSGIFCQLKYVPRWAKLKKGDDIVSSDIGGFYPPSLPIATVVGNEIKGGALFQSVKVIPKVNISKIESVLVIVK